jgi:hypothetical protein
VDVATGRLVTVTRGLTDGIVVAVARGAEVLVASSVTEVAVGATAGVSGMEQANPVAIIIVTSVNIGDNLFIFPPKQGTSDRAALCLYNTDNGSIFALDEFVLPY